MDLLVHVPDLLDQALDSVVLLLKPLQGQLLLHVDLILREILIPFYLSSPVLFLNC